MTKRKAPPPGYTHQGLVDLRKLPIITELPLARSNAQGRALQVVHTETHEPPTLQVDCRLRGRLALETALHEAVHLAAPWLFEQAVTRLARYLAMVIWKMGYRRLPAADRE